MVGKVDTNLDKLFSLEEIEREIEKLQERLQEWRYARKKLIERNRHREKKEDGEGKDGEETEEIG